MYDCLNAILNFLLLMCVEGESKLPIKGQENLFQNSSLKTTVNELKALFHFEVCGKKRCNIRGGQRAQTGVAPSSK